jgi:regulatory protein
VAADVADAVLGRLTEVGLIDDEAFAAALVSSGRERRGLGRRALAVDLRRHGVDEEVGAAALAVMSPEEEETSARELVARRLTSMEQLSPDARARRVAGLLARKGYSEDVVTRVVADTVGPEMDTVDVDVDAIGSSWAL